MKLKSLVVLICRTEVEKVPKIVYPHEIEVLRVIHGEGAIEVTETESPLPEQEVELDQEYGRMVTEYARAAGGDKPHPVLVVYKDVDGFIDYFDEKPKRSAKKGE